MARERRGHALGCVVKFMQFAGRLPEARPPGINALKAAQIARCDRRQPRDVRDDDTIRVHRSSPGAARR
jgi:hypothetical protein